MSNPDRLILALTELMLNSFPNMRKHCPKRPCAKVWLYSFADIEELASSAKMAPPANVALLRVKLARVDSDMITYVRMQKMSVCERGVCARGVCVCVCPCSVWCV